MPTCTYCGTALRSTGEEHPIYTGQLRVLCVCDKCGKSFSVAKTAIPDPKLTNQ